VIGRIAVDPSFWFFKAHFFQDPVWPGSLGLESFLQLV
jgi:3-hydroxymyristoyl/3-hydroxydecanoyl-(acyl carrier protein) dehydratase